MYIINQHNFESIPREGLIHEWLLHGDANDSAGSNNWDEVGTVSYGQNRKGENNKAAIFVDQNNYFNFLSDLNIGTVYTISFWVEFDTSKAPMVLNKWSDGSTFYFSSAATNVAFRVPSGSTTVSTGGLSTSTWIHMILARNGTDINYYFDNGTAKNGTAAANQDTLIRNLNTRYLYTVDDTYSVVGRMSDIRIYDRVLTPEERLALFTE